jgi:hypothetical protein
VDEIGAFGNSSLGWIIMGAPAAATGESDGSIACPSHGIYWFRELHQTLTKVGLTKRQLLNRVGQLRALSRHRNWG